MMKANIIKLTFALLPALTIACGSTMKVGEKKEMKDGSGKVIGQFEQVAEKEMKATWDTDQNGKAEKVVTLKDEKLDNITYLDNESGNTQKEVKYEEGKPALVNIYDSKKAEVKGIAKVNENKKITEVTLPGKKTKVLFNEDGTIGKTEPVQ